MSSPQIIKLLEFCLKHTYFLFQGKDYKQVHGAAMGSFTSPVIANLFMEEFVVKAHSTAPQPTCVSGLWIIPLSSKRQNTLNNFFTTSTHSIPTYSSQWRNQIKMGLFHSWTPRSHQGPTPHSILQFTESQQTQINIYIGTATTS